MQRPDRLPEPIRDHVTAEELMQRLRSLRDAYDAGALPASRLNQILEYFQFTDDGGDVWAPGASSMAWYRWNGAVWERAEPPAQLAVPSELRDAPWQAVEPVANAPADVPLAASAPAPSPRCSACGAPVPAPGARFCEQCGVAL